MGGQGELLGGRHRHRRHARHRGCGDLDRAAAPGRGDPANDEPAERRAVSDGRRQRHREPPGLASPHPRPGHAPVACGRPACRVLPRGICRAHHHRLGRARLSGRGARRHSTRRRRRDARRHRHGDDHPQRSRAPPHAGVDQPRHRGREPVAQPVAGAALRPDGRGGRDASSRRGGVRVSDLPRRLPARGHPAGPGVAPGSLAGGLAGGGAHSVAVRRAAVRARMAPRGGRTRRRCGSAVPASVRPLGPASGGATLLRLESRADGGALQARGGHHVSTRAVILAAGRGSRLGPRLAGLPKCLLTLGGVTLLERQLASLRLAGIKSCTVVAGYEAPRVSAICAGLADVLVNDRFAETNSMYSLWLARTFLADGFIVMNGDVLFHPQLLTDLLSSRFDDALLVAFRDPTAAPFGDEEMKVKVRGGRVADISKTLPAEDTDGENVGVARFSPDGAALLCELMDDLVGQGRLREWAPRAFQAFAARRPLHAVGTRGYPWIEIDFQEDYQRACAEVLPQLDGDAGDTGELPVLGAPPMAAGDSPAEWRPQTRHV